MEGFFVVDVYVFTVLIDAFCNKGMVGETQEVFDEMIEVFFFTLIDSDGF